MIERVAMAMWAENLKRGAGEFCAPWGLETDALREDWRAFAAAAINEMREPTEAMVEAGSNSRMNYSADAKIIWQDMIAAAKLA